MLFRNRMVLNSSDPDKVVAVTLSVSDGIGVYMFEFSGKSTQFRIVNAVNLTSPVCWAT
jgi:hypothetical protein